MLTRKLTSIVKSFFKKITTFVLHDIYFYGSLFLVMLGSSILNYNADDMSGILHYYKDYANFILSGFDFNFEFSTHTNTFPMWGYGFMLAITQNKFIIVIFQQIFTFLVIIFTDYSIRKLDFSLESQALFRLTCLFSIHWFMFHTVLWPYSIGANLLLLSLLLMVFYFKNKKLYLLFFSAILLGLMLNFRSDYYFFTFVIFSIFLILKFTKKIELNISHLVLWTVFVLLMLLPWGLYTYKRTGHYLHTSTNGGHALFLSLGILPNNKWKITFLDSDPVMQNILKEELGLAAPQWSHREDVLLRKKWVTFIKEHPIEYLKKCLYSG